MVPWPLLFPKPLGNLINNLLHVNSSFTNTNISFTHIHMKTAMHGGCWCDSAHKTLSAEPGDPSSVPRTHGLEDENWHLQVVLWPSHKHAHRGKSIRRKSSCKNTNISHILRSFFLWKWDHLICTVWMAFFFRSFFFSVHILAFAMYHGNLSISVNIRWSGRSNNLFTEPIVSQSTEAMARTYLATLAQLCECLCAEIPRIR